LNSLRYWVQGVPDPASPSTETADPQGYLGSLVQSDWTVTYGAYMQTADGALPQKVTVERGNVRVRLVLDAWHAP
jgi:outer membrane lipoprotein LolB